ncbi:MAG: alpha/beta fold hydrolase [Candidatus Hydrogenedentes bacterium]|nr:alpha/beta fold hydrolase [Candidatus Hydrogenedentota bacterium]
MTSFLIGVAAVAILLALAGIYRATLEDIYKERLSTDEAYLVTTKDLWQIRMCRYRKGRTNGQPVLLVHGAIVNQHTFTSPRGGSLVDYLVERGYDCWTVDLRGARSSIPPFERHRNQVTFDDYLNDDIPTAIQFIKQETGYARVHYCGQSMGGMLLYAYVLKYGAGDIASAVTLGAPIGFDGVRIRLSGLLIGLVRVYPPLFGSVARALIPLVRAFRLTMPYFPMNARNLAKGLTSYYLYNMLEDPLPGVLRQLAGWVNTPGWKMDGGALDVQAGLASLDLPLFAIFAPLDPFVPAARAQAFFDALPGADKRMLLCAKERGFKHDYNHCELAFGEDGAREIFGPIARWFETHTIREHLPIAVDEVATDYQTPLQAGERAEILSGESFAHLSGVQVAPPEPEKPAEPPRAESDRPRKASAKKVEDATPRGPDLKSVSAAITALRPPPGSAPAPDVAPIRVQAPAARPATGGNTVETPQSVLKALSNASGALEAFKERKADSDEEES